ncbi:MAG: SAM-dependent methyltransferase [Mariprofundales bacterium]|nr:SAM-dependent methyltransferase [Mariprofundales bacterium]
MTLIASYPIPFSEWMANALYDPTDGYYETHTVFADQGDFVTAANLGGWAALAFADLIVWSWQSLGSPSSWALVEQGGGDGQLLLDVVRNIRHLNLPEPIIYSVEHCTAMRGRQSELFSQHGVAVMQCASLKGMPPLANAVLMSNELPDAFPVRRFVSRADGLHEMMVAQDGAHFVWQEHEAVLTDGPEIAPAIMGQWREGYVSEWNPNLASWLQHSAAVAQRSVLLCVDYGFAQREYYRPERSDGTLMGHARHQVVEDVLTMAGECDITAHVDFSALHRAAAGAGIAGQIFTPQWAWLAQSPSVQKRLAEVAVKGDLASVQAVAQAKRLMLPQGMGETFKLYLATHGIASVSPDYLRGFNRLQDLAAVAD